MTGSLRLMVVFGLWLKNSFRKESDHINSSGRIRTKQGSRVSINKMQAIFRESYSPFAMGKDVNRLSSLLIVALVT